MAWTPDSGLRRLAEVVEDRVGRGKTAIVAGWQSMLTDMLRQMAPFMRPGRLVTFASLTDEEKTFFERLHRRVPVPGTAAGCYLPPSVRRQMMGAASDAVVKVAEPDAGVVLASRINDTDTVVNSLFAFPPFTPAVDVYEHGRFTAGYQFNTIDECTAALGGLLHRHLG